MEYSMLLKILAYVIGVYQRLKHPNALNPWECDMLMLLAKETPDCWVRDVIKYYRNGTREG